MARFAPASDSMVRSIRTGRACVSTSMLTSSGMDHPRSGCARNRSRSARLPEGHLDFGSRSRRACGTCQLLSAFIGSNSAWLPSRRSVLIHRGLVDGPVRPGPVGEPDRREGAIFLGGLLHVRSLSLLSVARRGGVRQEASSSALVSGSGTLAQVGRVPQVRSVIQCSKCRQDGPVNDC